MQLSHLWSDRTRHEVDGSFYSSEVRLFDGSSGGAYAIRYRVTGNGIGVVISHYDY